MWYIYIYIYIYTVHIFTKQYMQYIYSAHIYGTVYVIYIYSAHIYGTYMYCRYLWYSVCGTLSLYRMIKVVCYVGSVVLPKYEI